MASSSSSSHEWKYDVFLNFRGEDTRKKIISHLFDALHQRGINVFKDDDKLKRGEEISPALLKAIEESRISIVVFSKNYASSTWCLDELVKILECRREKKQLVLPLFCEVDPSEVRKQHTGSFRIAMAEHEKRFVNDKNKLKNWMKALEEATSLTGLDFKNYRDESSFIKEIIKDILEKLNKMEPSPEDDPWTAGQKQWFNRLTDTLDLHKRAENAVKEYEHKDKSSNWDKMEPSPEDDPWLAGQKAWFNALTSTLENHKSAS